MEESQMKKRKYTVKELQRKIGRLTLKLSDIRHRESNSLKEMRKYCKELDKLINKKRG